MKRKLLALLFAFSLIKTNIFALNNDIKVMVNGKPLNLNTSPIVENGRVLTPMKEIFETLGAEIQWFPESQKIEARKNGKDIFLFIGDNELYTGSIEPLKLEVSAKTVTISSATSSLKIIKSTESREIKADDGTVIINIQYDYPLIDNPNNDSIINEFNYNYEMMAKEFIRACSH